MGKEPGQFLREKNRTSEQIHERNVHNPWSSGKLIIKTRIRAHLTKMAVIQRPRITSASEDINKKRTPACCSWR